MKVLVLGAGVIGTTSAYYLAKAGHDVTVVDRQSAAAEETSFGNAGQISPGYSAPWAGPALPGMLLKWLFASHSPLLIQPRLDIKLFGWMLQALRNCTMERYRQNRDRMLRLADYSRVCLDQLRTDIDIQYDGRQLGTLQLLRTPRQMDAIAKDVKILQSFGVPHQVLNPADCAKVEPALGRVAGKYAGGLHLPKDQTGDCNLFTKALASRAEGADVQFLFGRTVTRLIARDGRIETVLLADGTSMTADAVIVALGSYSPLLLAPLGLRLPVYPVKGYSLTLPVRDSDAAPVSTVMDEGYKIAITRLGDRIRVGGRAELAGYDLSLIPRRRAALEYSLTDLFPDGGDTKSASFWMGLRPMTPDGTPVVGTTPYANLFTNTGHGTLGWTMACGSGRLIADIVSGRTPEIKSDDLTLARYH